MTTEERRFAVFILTHGRANCVYTYKALRKHGYTGEIYLVCDDEDKQIKQYLALYGPDSVIVFNKQEAIDNTDSGDNFKKRNSVVYARNQNFKIAAGLGLTHFWQLDDDYSNFGYATDNDDEYITKDIYTKRLDDLLFSLCDFIDESGAHSVAMSQGGDFIGGGEGTFVKHIKKGKFSRKVMNSFLFRVDRPVKFMGRINEDVNMYVEWGRRGHLFVTVPRLRLWQKETQANAGGLTEIYLDLGTYVKSFYSVLYAPSCVSIAEMGRDDRRIHHSISWRHAVPMILDEQHRKPRLLSRYTNTVQEM
jgi:hypothetical protein